MMKTLTLLAVALVAPMWAAEEPKPNPVVEKAMAAALADAEKGYDAYKAVLAKATDKALKDLEKAKLEVMKKGDLVAANELDARIKELKEGGLEKLVTEQKKAGGDLLGGAGGDMKLPTLEIPKPITDAMAFVREKANPIADRAEKLRFIAANFTKPCLQLYEFYIERIESEGHYSLRLPALQQLTLSYASSEKVYSYTLGLNPSRFHFAEGATAFEYLAKEHGTKQEVQDKMKAAAADKSIHERVRQVAIDFCRAKRIKYE